MSRSPKKEKCHATIRISGMHCSSCEVLLERKLKTIPGVEDVSVHYRTGTAHITADANHLPDEHRITSVIRKAGYQLDDDEMPTTDTVKAEKQKWLEIGGSLLVIFAVYKLLQAFDLVSIAPSTSGALSFGGIFVIGLVAGTSSCLAVTGGLLLALAAKHNELHQAETPWQKFTPLLQFNLGRLVSYFVFGGFVGVIGQSVTLSPKMSGYMNIAVALIMLWLALTILHVIPKGIFSIRLPKRLSHRIHSLSESDHPAAPFALGACTFFLPCGFTQSLQLVALVSGNFMTGAMTMFVFALGTLPSLIGLSAVSSTAKGATSRVFLRFSGALVLVLAFFNLNSGFALTGFNFSSILQGPPVAVGSTPTITNGVQEVAMKVTRAGYEPSNLTIQAGVPVQWKVDGSQALGCTSIMTIPSLNISRALHSGENIISFTAPEKGVLPFMCSMGMVRGSFNVL